jgi:hypothetical protein
LTAIPPVTTSTIALRPSALATPQCLVIEALGARDGHKDEDSKADDSADPWPVP